MYYCECIKLIKYQSNVLFDKNGSVYGYDMEWMQDFSGEGGGQCTWVQYNNAIRYNTNFICIINT